MLQRIVSAAPLFLLIFARIFALMRTAPLLSSGSFPGVARIALVFFTSFAVFPSVAAAGYPIPATAAGYVLLIVGEVLIGLISALFLVILFAVFQLAGQFFSLQMGFGASQVFDPMAQVQIPIVGQFLNVIAMMVFIVSSGVQRIVLHAVQGSFSAMTAYDIAARRGDMFTVVSAGLGALFTQSLVLSLPILGILFMLSVTMGLFGKAAPQMNLLLLGFPMAIGIAFLSLLFALPFLVEAFEVVIEFAFSRIGLLFRGGPS